MISSKTSCFIKSSTKVLTVIFEKPCFLSLKKLEYMLKGKDKKAPITKNASKNKVFSSMELSFIKYCFKKAKPKSLMDAEEMETYLQLPDTITIYRGIHTKKYYPALSWTLSLNTAKFFANRFDKKGMVYQTDIPKSAILAYFAGEEEVIVDYKQIDKTKLQIVSKGENV